MVTDLRRLFPPGLDLRMTRRSAALTWGGTRGGRALTLVVGRVDLPLVCSQDGEDGTWFQRRLTFGSLNVVLWRVFFPAPQALCEGPCDETAPPALDDFDDDPEHGGLWREVDGYTAETVARCSVRRPVVAWSDVEGPSTIRRTSATTATYRHPGGAIYPMQRTDGRWFIRAVPT